MLFPHEAIGLLDLGTAEKALTFDLRDLRPRADWFVYQIVSDAGTAWPSGATAVVTVEISQDGAAWNDFPSGAVTKSAFGFGTTLTVTGVNFVRFRVSTAGGSSVNARVLAEAGRTS